jgi:uncharacterized protein YgbK (DUF1537 family)
MHEHLAPALAALAALGAPVLQYKVCSTFDSSPTIGSIGCAIDLGVPLMRGDWSPCIVGVPRLGRYQAFGHLFAVAQGTGYRLDRHPTMSRHPVTPMGESDLGLHLGGQTQRRRALVDFTQLKAGKADQALRAACTGTGTLAGTRPGDTDGATEVPVVLIDVLDDETLTAAGRLVWEHRGAGVFSASSSGLQYALTAHWRATGVIAAPEPLPEAGPAGRIAVVSGSCSPGTAAQIDWAGANGFALHRLDLPGLFAEQAAAAAQSDDRAGLATSGEVDRAIAAGRAALLRGMSPLVYSACGPGDAAVRRFGDHAAAAGLSRAQAALCTGQALAAVLCGLLDQVPGLRRVAVAGGDSSGDVTAALGVQALTMAAHLAPGAPLCRAWSDLPARDGLELVLKGGQMGDADFFGRVRDGVRR